VEIHVVSIDVPFAVQGPGAFAGRILFPVLFVSLLTVGVRPVAAIQDSRELYRVEAVRIAEGPVIDGSLDEAVWQRAAVIDQFIQQEPEEGAPATERTEVRVLYDGSNLYVGVRAYDSGSNAVIASELRRDSDRLLDEDNFQIILDTFNDSRSAYMFVTSPLGAKLEQQIFEEGEGGRRGFSTNNNINRNWDGVWYVATQQLSDGWIAEIAIPMVTVRFPNSERQDWGINFMRNIRRKNEQVFWAPIPRAYTLTRVSLAGSLTNLESLNRGLDLRIKPFVLGGGRRVSNSGVQDNSTQEDFGVDVKYGVTAGMNLDLTVNTDFAQAEIDDEQINLTRFPLFFPEKREFFLENAGQFNVGTSTSVFRVADLFFSRRIGISGGGQVPIKGGGRLSGKVGGLNVGLLHIQTEGLGTVPENAYSVARVARELPNRSRVGALFVDRSANVDGDYNRTYAIDGRLGIGEAITLTSFVGRTETPGLVGDDHIVDATAAWSSRSWTSTLQAREIGEAFNPEVGFLPRNGHRYYQAYLQRFIRPGRVFREIRPHVSYFTFRSRKTGVERGFTETSRLHVDSHWEWPSGTQIHTGANFLQEGLVDPFAISGTDVVVAPGSYEGWEAAFVLMSDRSAAFAVDTRVNIGSFLSGDRRRFTATATVRRGAAFTTSLRLEYNDVDLAEGSFETRLVGVNFGYFFTPRIYVQSLVQYSDQIDRLSANLRFGWLNTAGTGLFVVYNDIQGIDQLDGPLGRSLIVKFTRQLNVVGR